MATKTIVITLIASLALTAAACGSPSRSPAQATPAATPAAAAHATASAPAAPPAATGPVQAMRVQALALPVALDAESAVAIGNRVYVIGGIVPDGSTTADMWTADFAAGGPWHKLGSLPQPTHDAAAAILGGAIDVFGGGVSASVDTAWQINPATGAATALPKLPRPLSDAGIGVVGSTAYIVGGFDATNFRTEILSWRPGETTYQVAGHLPAGLRYAAVAASDGQLLIFGGVTVNGVSNAILRFDPASGSVTRLGSMPVAAEYMSAAPAPRNGAIWVMGGFTHNGPLADIWSWTAGATSLTRLAALPASQYYGAAVAIGSSVYVLGGKAPDGNHTTDAIRVR